MESKGNRMKNYSTTGLLATAAWVVAGVFQCQHLRKVAMRHH